MIWDDLEKEKFRLTPQQYIAKAIKRPAGLKRFYWKYERLIVAIFTVIFLSFFWYFLAVWFF